MSFPSSLTLVTVSIQVDEPPSGGGDGFFEFKCPYALLGETIVPPFTRTVALNSSGAATIPLPATDDPQWSPAGWAYTVTGKLGGEIVTGTLTLPHGSPTATLAARLQVDGAAAGGVSYILTSQRSVAGGVAGLDVDGDVIDADGNKVTGGGGGGGTPSSTVVSETSYGQSATAGSGSTYSRGNHSHGTPVAPSAATITDSTTVGRAVLTAADASAARTAIGAAVSTAPDAAVTAHVALSDPHTQYVRIFTSTGASYTASTTAEIYIGPNDPGTLPAGSLWIDTDA